MDHPSTVPRSTTATISSGRTFTTVSTSPVTRANIRHVSCGPRRPPSAAVGHVRPSPTPPAPRRPLAASARPLLSPTPPAPRRPLSAPPTCRLTSPTPPNTQDFRADPWTLADSVWDENESLPVSPPAETVRRPSTHDLAVLDHINGPNKVLFVNVTKAIMKETTITTHESDGSMTNSQELVIISSSQEEVPAQIPAHMPAVIPVQTEPIALPSMLHVSAREMSRVNLLFSQGLTTSDPGTRPVLVVGQLKNLTKVPYDVIKVKLEPRVTEETYHAAMGSLHPSPTDSCPMWLTSATLAALPTKCSRHNTPARTHALTRIVRSFMSGDDEFIVVAPAIFYSRHTNCPYEGKLPHWNMDHPSTVLRLVCERSEALASACAVARAFPLYSRKSGVNGAKRTVTVEFVIVGSGPGSESVVGPLSESDISAVSDAACSVRLTARITDTPCAEMNTDNFLDEICKVGQKLGIESHIIQGEELRARGFGGLYAVGKAAVHAPALAVLSHQPEGAERTLAWVGKGIVYDTGGLSIKGKTTMPGMKRDCGGAAAVLGAFYAAVKQGFGENLHAVFCLAENAVGPHALRPDDVITLYSGRTVEVNNTDAEGRLVLGDGVAYASKDLKADVIVDMATLTGAQGLATGRYHGALVTNNEDWEVGCVHAGRVSGDLLHPLLYCPELHFSEFASAIADMKNSSADRSNAEVSCAGLFIGAHLGFDFPGTWLHVDMAYPVYSGERATGYGVALLLMLFGESSNSPLLRSHAPSVLSDGYPNDESASKKIRLA